MLKKLMHCDELWVGEKIRILVEGRALVLVHTEAGFSAFHDRCPHAGARMSDGYLDGEVLMCERHHWQFNACTGKGINPLARQLDPYPLTIDAQGMIWVDWGADNE